MKKTKIHKIVPILILAVGINLTSCSDDFLDPGVTQYATSSDMVAAGGDVINSILLGAYNVMIEYQGSHDVYGEMALGLAGDMMTEDITFGLMVHWHNFDYFIDNNGPTYRRVVMTWNYLYGVISKCNEVIQAIPPDIEDNPSVEGVLAQALALRAYAYSLLAQRFQQTYVGNETRPGVPLTLTANDAEETITNRAPLNVIYAKIVADLNRAIELFENAPARTNKTVIDKQVAAGILARVYMVMHNWTGAVEMARMAREGYSLMNTTEIVNDNFGDIGNKEWMWGADITPENTTMFASFFSHICSTDQGYGQSNFAPKCIDAKLYS